MTIGIQIDFTRSSIIFKYEEQESRHHKELLDIVKKFTEAMANKDEKVLVGYQHILKHNLLTSLMQTTFDERVNKIRQEYGVIKEDLQRVYSQKERDICAEFAEKIAAVRNLFSNCLPCRSVLLLR